MCAFALRQVLEALGQHLESLERHLGPMLQWVEYAPVSETLVKLLACPSTTGVDTAYQVMYFTAGNNIPRCSHVAWRFVLIPVWHLLYSRTAYISPFNVMYCGICSTDFSTK